MNNEPQRLLLSLPGITTETYQAFETQMSGTRSEKEQRALVKKLLLHSGMSPSPYASSPVPSVQLESAPVLVAIDSKCALSSQLA